MAPFWSKRSRAPGQAHRHKIGAGAGVRTPAPARRTHTPQGVGTYHTAKSKSRSGATWQANSMSAAALLRTSMMSSTGVATRVHPSARARASSPLEIASDTFAADGTRWKSGDHWRSDARPHAEGGQDAVHRGVLAVPLHKGKLPGDIVDEGDPERAKSSGESDQGQDLSDNLQDVDEGLPGGEGGEVLRPNDPVVVEDVAV